jgi:ferrous iron transport protein B
MMTTQAAAVCETCPVYNQAHMKKLGVNIADADYVIALAGNPNTGKSTVFNALTGLHQHVGNWPGKTVARAEGGFNYNDKKYKLVDLPGTYSLLSTSVDEEIARDFILFAQPSVTVVVVDATRIERNLNLALQIFEITDRVVIALNLMDEAERHGLKIDARHLSRKLGVPVVPMTARQMHGVPELLQAIATVVNGSYLTKPHRIQHQDEQLEQTINSLVDAIQAEYPQLPNARWVALRLLDGDSSIEQAIREKRLGELSNGHTMPVGNFVAVEAVS